MIDAAHDLPVARQAEVLDLSRSSVYYRPRPVSPEDLALMRRIDELHLERPFAGSRMLRDFLEHEGVAVGRRHVATLMKRMGIEAIYRRRNSSKPAPGHKIYPYLLRGVKVERPNQVWATDITYIPMARGFVYLVAVVDWFTRRVLSHRVSITMDTTFCVEALEEAIGKHGRPEIFNSDQGSQFTSEAFTGVLLANGIAISMDGKGSWRDNVFVERLWKSVKYEEVYLKAYDTVARLAPRWVAISTSTIDSVRIRALTDAPRTRPTSYRRQSRRRHEIFRAALGLDLRSGYALPSSNPNAAETANPAGRHLSFAEICPDKRSQLCAPLVAQRSDLKSGQRRDAHPGGIIPLQVAQSSRYEWRHHLVKGGGFRRNA